MFYLEGKSVFFYYPFFFFSFPFIVKQLFGAKSALAYQNPYLVIPNIQHWNPVFEKFNCCRHLKMHLIDMPIFLECQKHCAEIHLLSGCIEPQCFALGVFSCPIEPVGCKSMRAGQAHLINGSGSLNRGVTAEAAAVLLSNCSVFCLISRMTIQVIFLPGENQILL